MDIIAPLMRIAFVTISLAILTACSTQHAARAKADRPLTQEEKRIVEIARQAVAANDTWLDRANLSYPGN
jgi:hypothetical protein